MRKCFVSFSCCHSDKISMCRLLLFSACEWFSNYGEGTSTIVVWMFDLFFYNLFLVSNFQQIIYIIIYFFYRCKKSVCALSYCLHSWRTTHLKKKNGFRSVYLWRFVATFHPLIFFWSFLKYPDKSAYKKVMKKSKYLKPYMVFEKTNLFLMSSWF